MKIFVRWLKRILIWAGPLLVLTIMIVAGFLVWALGTQAGTRWTLGTATQYFDGRAEGVRGTIASGVHIRNVAIALPSLTIEAQAFHLQVDWRELLDRRLHVRDLSARTLAVHVLSSDTPSSDAPLEVPPIPVQVQLDRLALGQLEMTIDGNPLPVGIAQLDTALALSETSGQLILRSLDVSHAQADVSLSGELRVLDLDKPWPAEARVDASVRGKGANSPLCLPTFVPGAKSVQTGTAQAFAACTADLQLTAKGDLSDLTMTLDGKGQGLRLLANARLAPQAAFPLRNADLDLSLGDGSNVQAQVRWNAASSPDTEDRVVGRFRTRQLNVARMAAGAIPEAMLSLHGEFDVGVRDLQQFEGGNLSLTFDNGSRWNGQPLAGELQLELAHAATQQGAMPDDRPPESWLPPIVYAWRVPVLVADLTIGNANVRLNGALGNAKDRIGLNANVPELAALWPALPGGLQADGTIGGSIAQHAADLQVTFSMPDSEPDVVGSAPVQVDVALNGGWGHGVDGLEGWRGQLTQLRVLHADFRVQSEAQTPISYVPAAQDAQWRVGDARLQLWQEDDHLLTVHSRQAQGAGSRWQTAGEIAQLRVTDARIARLRNVFAIVASAGSPGLDQGGVTVLSQRKQENDITFDLAWRLQYTDALQGEARIERTAGDLLIPADTPVPVGLQALALELTVNRAAAGVSRVVAQGRIATQDKGSLAVGGSFLLRTNDGWRIDPADGNRVQARAVVADLGWISVFTGNLLELGGTISADISAQSQADGHWATDGELTGERLRIVSLDQGVRLLDGTLRAHFDNDRVVLDSLQFPAQLRVEPKEWRTREWVYTNPDAKGGNLTLTGQWNLAESVGSVAINLKRYPILQRSDRYAMVTGELLVDAQMPAVSVTGAITADAGWIDLDIVGGVPSVDGDVVVVRKGVQPKQASAPTDLSLDLTVDLGPRFYLTGYGLNSGLIGKLRLLLSEGKMTAQGALNTRGGAIEAYGQRLQLRRGTITFQGDIASPVLDIEALRTDVAVQAGVRVGGTARRPRIDLVSYPEVAEVEKLSWLLLGRGPDDSGGDAALLLSVGTSLLTGGEPFYRRFGLDEVSLRSGELGAAGSILPAESVVRSLDSGTSDIERQFVLISKTLGQGFVASVEQALSDSGTVGRVSYRLARGLSARLSVGTVNGLALVYRFFGGN